MHSDKHFLISTISVQENAVKNILFQASTMLLRLAVFKIFSFLAFKMNAYTSFLMFTEDTIQKLFFLTARPPLRHSLLVLAFAVAFASSGLYDTLLWALDSPGYITKSTTVDVSASLLSSQLLADPLYNVFISNPEKNLDLVDIDQAISGGLFKSGFNFSLPGVVAASSKGIAPATQPFNLTGPRIWLDNEGLSVSVNGSGMSFCPPVTVDANSQAWRCAINNTNAYDMLVAAIGQPRIFWNADRSDILLPNRKDNPWASLGTGGDTAAMKQVFTVTKGNRRHTFLETVLKVSMLAFHPAMLDAAEVTDLIRRTWAPDPTKPIDATTQLLVDHVLEAQANGTSFTNGAIMKQDNYSIYTATIGLFNPLQPGSDLPEYAILQTTGISLTLLRSETLVNHVVPAEPCPYYYTNFATGGKVRSTNCYKSTGNQTGARFLGQIDASSMVILSDILGDGSTSMSATAVNQTGLDWYLNHTAHIDGLLVSRAFILGGDPTGVEIELKTNEAALSYLQVILIVIPLFFTVASLVLMMRDKAGLYRSSFMCAVSAATKMHGISSKNVGYMRPPPLITPVLEGGHIKLLTPGGGMLGNVGVHMVMPYDEPVTEPFLDKT
ncbi:hypothetical protein BDQ12DRAFT_735865 [Crucibulum laeve]|uniref:Transmembrane protein n=1 Tax=Crucibulum laeve TaxID=68775 RepID=A0A5C3LXQ9_9AGAR|nr:hypothetical protein BDQ12DRAFT_735865 [Crucibulum laeve]